MFNKENFVTDYVEAVRTNNTEKMNEVLERLTPEQDMNTRKELITDILSEVEKLEGDYSSHVEFLNAQLTLIDVIAMSEDAASDSAAEVAKEDAETGQTTTDVETDGSAEEAEGEGTKAEAGAVTETEAESGGYAPAAEEEEGKSE